MHPGLLVIGGAATPGEHGTFGRSFLRSPFFTGTVGCREPWGQQALTLDLPFGPYRLDGLSARQARLLRSGYDGFLGECEEDNGARCLLLRCDPGLFRALPSEPSRYHFDLDPRPDRVHLAGWGFAARLTWAPTSTLEIFTTDDPELLPSVFANCLRVLVAYRALEAGGVLLHSAGIVDAGSALVFVGRSGAGKSTLSRLAHRSGREVLSDDLNVLRPNADGVVVERLPFTGDFRHRGLRGSFPVRLLLPISKTSQCEIRPISTARSAAILGACAPFVNRDPFRAEALLRNVAGVAGRLPARRLGFSLEGSFWSLLSGSAA